MKDRAAHRTLASRVGELRPRLAPTVARSVWPLGAGIVIALLLQVLIAPILGDFYAKLLLDIGIAIILAASLNIVNGFAGQFSLGHAGFMLVGGYAAAMVTYYGSIKLGWVELAGCAPSPPPGAMCDQEVSVYGSFLGPGDLLFLGACVVGGLVAATAGLVVGLPSLRLRGDYLAIVTLGFGEILRVLVQQTGEVPDPYEAKDAGLGFMVTHLGGASPFTGVPSYVSATPWLQDASGNNPGHAGIFFTFAIVGILLVAAYRLKSSAKGRELLAVRENEVAAEAMGVDTAKAKVSAFVFSAFFAGVGGGLFAHQIGTSLSPKDLGFQKSIDLVIMVVLGGMGSISGVVLAAVILTILPELFRGFSDYRMPIYALALIVVMIVRPQGLFGIKELWELAVWRSRELTRILLLAAAMLLLGSLLTILATPWFTLVETDLSVAGALVAAGLAFLLTIATTGCAIATAWLVFQPAARWLLRVTTGLAALATILAVVFILMIKSGGGTFDTISLGFMLFWLGNGTAIAGGIVGIRRRRAEQTIAKATEKL